jgi:hypothetical protein
VNRALTWTLLALAVVVVLFVATWLTIPGGKYEQRNLTAGRWDTGKITYPARLFRPGLVQRAAFCKRYAQVNVCASQIVYHRVDLHTVKQRVLITFGGLALAVILVGVAFGALGRKPPPRSEWTAVPRQRRRPRPGHHPRARRPRIGPGQADGRSAFGTYR